MIAKITAPDLARDCVSAAQQVAAHREYYAEIDGRKGAFDKFIKTGRALIADGHFMADEIEDKILTLSQRHELLLSSGQRREDIYQQNVDALNFERDAAQLESWLISREKLLAHDQVGGSIAEVEELIRRHEDFEKTLDAQNEKAEALKRITLVCGHVISIPSFRFLVSFLLIFCNFLF